MLATNCSRNTTSRADLMAIPDMVNKDSTQLKLNMLGVRSKAK